MRSQTRRRRPGAGPHPQQRSHAPVPGLPVADRCLVMGILNTTPDSFSDGSLHADPEAAVQHGIRLASDGADLVDVGGESTRPRAQRVSAAEELRRVLPVVRELAAEGVRVSIDTMRARVAAEALEAGALAVNDVSGGLADPAMARLVADAQVPYIAMHWRGHSLRMSERARYEDVVSDIIRELDMRLEALTAAGVTLERIVLDPGLGFAKTAAHNWAILRDLGKFETLGRPLLIGTSRKSFLGELMRDITGVSDKPSERDTLTSATTALAAAAGAYCVRVHDVQASRQAISVAQAWMSG